jgi:hypothetical protein
MQMTIPHRQTRKNTNYLSDSTAGASARLEVEQMQTESDRAMDQN